MGENYQYPIFFECNKLHGEQKNKVQAYFRVRRRSGTVTHFLGGALGEEHYQVKEETLVRRLSQTEPVGGVSDQRGENGQQSGGTLSQYGKNLHEDEAPTVNLQCLDVEDEPHLSERFGTLSFSETTTPIATYTLTDGIQLVVYQGDITTIEADALVNSANEDLNHCEGVAAALSQAGGPEVQSESNNVKKYKGKIPTGEVVVTSGGKLRCKRLLHAVGPVGGKANGKERMLLERTVRRALSLAEIIKFKSIAIPCIGSGVFGVPITVCSEAIVSAIKEFCSQGGLSLKTIALIDDTGEVVRAMQEACDRLLLGHWAAFPTESEGPLGVEVQFDSACQSVARGATAGAQKGLVHVEIVLGTIESQQVSIYLSKKG
ncbi:hypothetical protein XENOCAPTIV_002686 [Xenoophorus captivus]|uniref:Macro domain-containing protein n=1 Tax=Xenoophorus captivus TaxID=1517983 RepID=A0ABV0QQN4_9TELE